MSCLQVQRKTVSANALWIRLVLITSCYISQINWDTCRRMTILLFVISKVTNQSEPSLPPISVRLMYSRVTSLDMSPVDDTLLSAATDDTVRLWDLRSPNCQVSFSFHPAQLQCLQWCLLGQIKRRIASLCLLRPNRNSIRRHAQYEIHRVDVRHSELR